MSGSIFKLISNDDKEDRMLMATELLADNLRRIKQKRYENNAYDINPTLADIARSHILYVRAEFKPFVSIGFEYTKIGPKSGRLGFNETITFEIPDHGDFFNDMVFHMLIDEYAWEEVLTPRQGMVNFAFNTEEAWPPVVGNWWDGYYYSLVNVFDETIVEGVLEGEEPNPQVYFRNLARYVEYPANNLVRKVRMEANGMVMDEYTNNATVMANKCFVRDDKRHGYNRLVGQQNPIEGMMPFLYPLREDNKFNDIPNNTFTEYGLYSEMDPDNYKIYPLNNTSIPNTDLGPYAGEKMDLFIGPQTPKPVQPPLDLWVKLQLWFNNEVRLSVPSLSIPFGQRFIHLTLSSAADILCEYPNIYVKRIHERAIQDNIGDVQPSGDPIYRTQRLIEYYTVYNYTSSRGWANRMAKVKKMELYINNIFINTEIHDIYIKRIGFSLIKVHREFISRTNVASSSEKLLSQLKWPIEYMFIGLRPDWNTSLKNPFRWRDWHQFTRNINISNDQAVEFGETWFSQTLNGIPNTTPADSHYKGGHQMRRVLPTCGVWGYSIPTVDNITITAQEIVVYNEMESAFFHSYMPFHYGNNDNINYCYDDCYKYSKPILEARDRGVLFVTFSLLPGRYQPSGYLNISRARDTYLKWNTSYVNTSGPCDVIVVAMAINILVLAENEASLRYST